MEASNLSDREFKEMLTRMLKSMKKWHRNHKKGPVRNTEYSIFEMKNTLEGIKSSLNEADNKISNLENKVEKNTQ